MPVLLKDHTAEELHARLAHVGVSLHLARQLQAAAVRHDELPAELPSTSARTLARVRAVATVPRLELVEKVESSGDGFVKYLFRGDGPESSKDYARQPRHCCSASFFAKRSRWSCTSRERSVSSSSSARWACR